MPPIRPAGDPFDLRSGRAMVSLGALTNTQHCTYSCPFCYVQAGFLAYPRLSVDEIVSWVSDQPSGSYDIIYVSGDTDSFAPPRTDRGIELMERLAPLGKDILFTTRMVLPQTALDRLAGIQAACSELGTRLYGCVSITQRSVPHIEPRPISDPRLRVAQLYRFRELGLATILAMRPFLPVVPLSDYEWILEQASPAVHAVLGEEWYADVSGQLESRVLGGGVLHDDYTIEKMPFDSNEQDWKVFHGTEIRAFVTDWCSSAGVPFFMHSRDAIEWIRGNGDGW